MLFHHFLKTFASWVESNKNMLSSPLWDGQTDIYKHFFPVLMRSPVGSGGFTGQSSPLFCFDHADVNSGATDSLEI